MSLRISIVMLAVALGLTMLFWGPLWQGHGLIGGDLYSYFFPQKVVYAEQLAAGHVPLWNDLVGFGYPLLAESQTGVFYPTNQILYRGFDVNTAYHVNQLVHYVGAFVCTWLLMRRLSLSVTAATLAAVVFVYGWFPPRICLEWAIIGGVYFPFSLWCVESFLQSHRRGWLLWLAVAQGCHLLAGHFNLAFITQLVVVSYATLRVFGESSAAVATGPTQAVRSSRAARFVSVGLILLAIGLGFALAAIQLLPTWELKQLSQREGLGSAHDPGYGHIPPWYLSQMVAPWLWYAADVDPDQALQSIRAWSIDSGTNKVEAHLYFGLIPLLLIGSRFWAALRGDPLDRRHRDWLWLGLAAMVYTTGWLLPITRHLPGFSFFMGPGRYGIVTTLAAALLAGSAFDRLLARRRLPFRSVLVGLILGLTIVDLLWVSRRVTYAVMVDDPPIKHLEESAVRELLTRYEAFHGPERKPRMFAPGANLATLTGFAAYPAYLGLGPAAYYDPQLTMPEPTPEMSATDQAAAETARLDWLNEASVTHVLSMEPLDEATWPGARLVWQGFDRLLNPAWGRREPLSLYELPNPTPRVRTLPAATPAVVETTSAPGTGLRVTLDGGGELVWADLNYPGWSAGVEIGEGFQPADVASSTRLPFRTVDLPANASAVEWEFKSPTFRAGATLSLITAALMTMACAAVVLRRRKTPADASVPTGR